LLIAAIAGVAFLWFGWVEPTLDHSRWFGEVHEDIKGLLRKRPPDVPKGQWEFAVGWTLNLHGNAGGIWYTVERGWRPGFAAELHRRLAGPVGLADIEWIWDEYAAHTKHGAWYSDKFRPTRSEAFPLAVEGCFGLPVD
jgi:hypothetical protein